MTGLKVGEKALVTTQNWFLAPDGAEYRAVFGTIKGIHSDQETLGIKTNAHSANWYLEIGNMVIAGCQIMYAIKTNDYFPGDAIGWHSGEKGINIFNRPCAIYNADSDVMLIGIKK